VNNKQVFLCLIAAITLMLAGCRTAPIYNVASAPVIAPKQVSMQDVERAITRAGAGLGWIMNPKGPGQIEGTLLLRTHKAVVDITYDTKTYDIKYKDSANLDYDGSGIHSNYNGWVLNLEKAIRTHLGMM